MTTRKKPETPEEQWDAIVEMANGAEAREIDAMSDEEVKASLRAMGLDFDRISAEGARLARAFDPVQPATDNPWGHASPRGFSRLPAPKPAWAMPVLAASLFVVVACATLYFAMRESRVPAPTRPKAPVEQPAPSPDLVAKNRRDEARPLCETKAYTACLALLDEAKKLDPIGDDAEDVKALRAAAREAMVPPENDTKAPDTKGK